MGDPTCEGLTARWCPRCGTCTCPPESSDLATLKCPLHGLASQHGEDDGRHQWVVAALPDEMHPEHGPTEVEVRVNMDEQLVELEIEDWFETASVLMTGHQLDALIGALAAARRKVPAEPTL